MYNNLLSDKKASKQALAGKQLSDLIISQSYILGKVKGLTIICHLLFVVYVLLRKSFSRGFCVIPWSICAHVDYIVVSENLVVDIRRKFFLLK